MFPCFDQPDLKAIFDLTVRAPKEWIVVSTGAGRSAPVGDEVREWGFTTTPRMSTYIFSLHAGEYRVWEDQVESRTPLRLFAREALAANVDVDEWFETSRTGLAFYEEYFGIAYPFEKYDQLIVPDLAIGAMENAAAVTFAEGFVQRQLSTRPTHGPEQCHPARDGTHVVWKPGDEKVVEWTLVEREFRHAHVDGSPGRGTRVSGDMARVLRPLGTISTMFAWLQPHRVRLL